MTRSKFLTIPAVFAGALGISAGSAYAAEPTTEQLLQRIDQLQAKVQQLETRQSDSLSARDVDATIEKVLSDAEKRSQLLQMEGFTAGYSRDRFVIQDAQGNWVLRPRFEFQFRNTTNYRSDAKQGGDEADIEHGFSVNRMAFGADGTAFSPDLTYFFMWNSADGGSLSLEEAWIKYFINDDFAIRAGQMRSPVFHEQAVRPTQQLAVDRSMAHAAILGANDVFTQAVTIQYDPQSGPLWAEVGLEDGFNSGNTSFLDPNEGGSTNWGVFARANYVVKGDKNAYNDFTAMGNRDDLLVIGAGGDITQIGDVNSYLHTVDIQWENTNGLGLYGAYMGDWLDAAGDDFYNFGVLVQAGYMLNDKWEVFGRGDYASIDEDLVVTGDDDDFWEFTVGANWYLSNSHAAKVTIDLSVLPDGAPSDNVGLGVLAGDETQVILRGQFQLVL
jgi:hypothetical protein